MKILKNYKVPTGNILVVQGERGKLELLSIGDYGKEKNVKADFLGLKNEINGVPHGEMQPLEKKWVITICSQYGCSMGCKFCDVPKVGLGINATFNDMINQVKTGISLHPEVKETQRLNVHYARMGEPTFNVAVLDATLYLAGYLKERNWGFHPVVSTMMPIRLKNKMLWDYIERWMRIKNDILNGEAGLQLSINTTDEMRRGVDFSESALPLYEIGLMMKKILRKTGLEGRKVTLNFALTDAEIDAQLLREYFDPKYFICKITPMHMTKSCEENNLLTEDGYEKFYPYQKAENDLKKMGFDVIVFIPSIEEDLGRITCGNAILSGSMPECEYKVIK